MNEHAQDLEELALWRLRGEEALALLEADRTAHAAELEDLRTDRATCLEQLEDHVGPAPSGSSVCSQIAQLIGLRRAESILAATHEDQLAELAADHQLVREQLAELLGVPTFIAGARPPTASVLGLIARVRDALDAAAARIAELEAGEAVRADAERTRGQLAEAHEQITVLELKLKAETARLTEALEVRTLEVSEVLGQAIEAQEKIEDLEATVVQLRAELRTATSEREDLRAAAAVAGDDAELLEDLEAERARLVAELRELDHDEFIGLLDDARIVLERWAETASGRVKLVTDPKVVRIIWVDPLGHELAELTRSSRGLAPSRAWVGPDRRPVHLIGSVVEDVLVIEDALGAAGFVLRLGAL